MTVETVREVCRVEEADVSDARLKDLIAVATAEFDGYGGMLGRALIRQTWRQDFLSRYGPYRLPFPDVSSAAAVWRSSAGVETIAPVALDEDVIGPFVTATGWGVGFGGSLRVTFAAGYGEEPKDVPAPIREAILKRVGQQLLEGSDDGQVRSFQVEGGFTEAFNSPEQRQAEVDRSVRALVKPYRRGNLL
ncbi:hypothetical protein [Aureimonas sp. ME7]|uniref:hypothetical protein n=1 Tax=Aureimonas sp. ME7 TaxID=2744252 RepID=UPI0015FBAC74|nr:hypothetical protein [Aureimonas sp. ME7]